MADHWIGHLQQPTNFFECYGRAPLTLVLDHPFLGDPLERVVGRNLRGSQRNLLFGSGIESCGQFLARFIPIFARGGDTDGRPRSQMQRFLPSEVTIVHAPQARAVWLNDEI